MLLNLRKGEVSTGAGEIAIRNRRTEPADGREWRFAWWLGAWARPVAAALPLPVGVRVRRGENHQHSIRQLRHEHSSRPLRRRGCQTGAGNKRVIPAGSARSRSEEVSTVGAGEGTGARAQRGPEPVATMGLCGEVLPHRTDGREGPPGPTSRCLYKAVAMKA